MPSTIANNIINIVKNTMTKTLEGKNLLMLPALSKVKNYSKQKRIIDDFKNRLCKNLGGNQCWNTEVDIYLSNGDKVDILCVYGGGLDDFNKLPSVEETGENGNIICPTHKNIKLVVIEIDKPRADQIAKKMISRFPLALCYDIIYIAAIVPGTPHMNVPEAKKYIQYGRVDLKGINNNSELYGVFMDATGIVNVI